MLSNSPSVFARFAAKVALAALLLSGCASVLRGPGIEKVWPATWIYLPGLEPGFGSSIRFDPRVASIQKPLPAVIFLHGCSGYSPYFEQAAYPVALAHAGFAVFVPNSFARPGRQQACGNVLSDTVALRHAEIDETLEHMAQLPWVDKGNLFLAGHSEGGIATAMYGGGPFRAYFISGWTCRSTNPAFNSIHAPATRPVLAILGANDHYYKAQNVGHCGEAFEPWRNKDSRSIVLPGIDHEVNLEPHTIPTVVEFFKKYVAN